MKVFSVLLKVLAAIALLAYLFALSLDPSKEDALGPRFVSSSVNAPGVTGAKDKSAEPPGGIVVEGWIEKNRLEQGTATGYWIVVENDTGTKAELKSIELYVASALVKTERAVEETRPGEMWLKTGTLTPAGDNGRYAVVATVDVLVNGHLFRKGINLGPIETTTTWRERFLRVGKLQGLLLPLLLAIAGYAFQKFAEKGTQRNQVWNSLIPQLLERAELYYMPLNRAAKDLRDSFEHASTSPITERRLFVYRILIFLKRVRHLREKIGGLMFKDTVGEKLAAVCLNEIRVLIDATLPLIEKDTALDLIARNESYGRFVARFESHKPVEAIPNGRVKDVFAALESKASVWINNPAQFEPIQLRLKLLIWVLGMEMNRPLEPWYGKKDEVTEADIQGQRDLARGISQDHLEKVIEYTDDLKAERRWYAGWGL